MYLIAIAWIYVVLMMALVEAQSTQGTVLGAIITFVLYGLLPMGLLMYILGSPGRKRARKIAEAADEAQAAASLNTSTSTSTSDQSEPAAAGSSPPDGSGHAAGAPISTVGKEP